MSTDERGLYIALISIHGLIRGTDPELGRDADTGGQVRYVLELARALSGHPRVDRVELLTRQILAVNVDEAYSRPTEQIAERAWIVRLPCGPHRYLRKEVLWPHLPDFVDHALQHFRELGRVPDVVHSHYADAGAVAARLSRLVSAPMVHTGHSLGRVKKERLLERGLDEEVIERRYTMSRRIEAEEEALRSAEMVVASTEQEVESQWGMYESHARSKMVVIPPGVDISRFRPPRRTDRRPPFADEVDRFLADPDKPMVLALQRPDERKNLSTLIDAYAGNERLQQLANLVLLIGSRDDISELDRGQRRVLQEMLLAVDRHDLYGRVAYPKRHSPDDVPDIYRLAARRRGVFVNPALTEPFGLTLIEAAASGLPIVATSDGGPQTIVSLCNNGRLVDPLDPDGIAEALLEVLGDRRRWRNMSRNGVRGADRHFSWEGHVQRYVTLLERIHRRRARGPRPPIPTDRMVVADRLLMCDLDDTLLGDRESLDRLLEVVGEHRGRLAFGVATGRVLDSALSELEAWGVPTPDVLITSVGTEIHYRQRRLVRDRSWRRTIDHRWNRDAVVRTLEGIPGLRPQPDEDQGRYKASYFTDRRDGFPGVREVRRTLRRAEIACKVVHSHGNFLDVLPVRASKGHALRFLAHRWGFALEHVLVAGDSGNDAEMLQTGSQAVVVANHSADLKSLRGREGIHFAEAGHAAGILEGIRQFGFLGGQAEEGDDGDDA